MSNFDLKLSSRIDETTQRSEILLRFHCGRNVDFRVKSGIYIQPYKGFLNPRMTPVFDASGEITDVRLDFSETLEEQMLRYSRDYSVEI